MAIQYGTRIAYFDAQTKQAGGSAERTDRAVA
jgi:hypothetical protein